MGRLRSGELWLEASPDQKKKSSPGKKAGHSACAHLPYQLQRKAENSRTMVQGSAWANTGNPIPKTTKAKRVEGYG
jgi:hypothetical protein